MKVYISRYRDHWISPYTILERTLFWLDWEKIDYDTPWVERWSDRLEPVCKFIQTVLDLIHPRIQYIKIDPWDTWSMDHTLADIVLPMLRQLKATKHGSPNVAGEDVPEHLRSTAAPKKEDEWDIDAFHHDRWDWVLGEMIWAFEQKCRDHWEEDYYSGEHDLSWRKSDRTYPNFDTGEEEATYEMVPGPNHTFEINTEGMAAHQARMTNGFRLFGRYYEALWD